MTGWDFHPEALADLDEIWEFVSADDVDAADRLIAQIPAGSIACLLLPTKVTSAPTSHRAPCASFACANT